jgi:hypothetical protein
MSRTMPADLEHSNFQINFCSAGGVSTLSLTKGTTFLLLLGTPEISSRAKSVGNIFKTLQMKEAG